MEKANSILENIQSLRACLAAKRALRKLERVLEEIERKRRRKQKMYWILRHRKKGFKNKPCKVCEGRGHWDMYTYLEICQECDDGRIWVKPRTVMNVAKMVVSRGTLATLRRRCKMDI